MARGATIMGLAKLQRKLDRLPKVAKDQIQTKMAEAADEIVAMMKSLVPVLKEPDARRRAGALRDSIGWTWGKAPKGSMVVATLKGAGVGGDLTITVFAGSRDKSRGPDDAYYVAWVEFGTKKMKAQPFFYVSWRANRKPAARKVRKAVRDAARQVARGNSAQTPLINARPDRRAFSWRPPWLLRLSKLPPRARRRCSSACRMGQSRLSSSLPAASPKSRSIAPKPSERPSRPIAKGETTSSIGSSATPSR